MAASGPPGAAAAPVVPWPTVVAPVARSTRVIVALAGSQT